MEIDLNLKLRDEIKKFLEVYRILSPEGKAQFEAQMAAAVSKADEGTGRLYQSLLASAREGRDMEAAILNLHKVSREKG